MNDDPMLTDSLDGREEAERDIRNGVLKLKTYGYPPPWRGDYAEFLKDRYDVVLDEVVGCVVSEEFVRYVDEYNARVEEELVKRFGDGVLRAIATERKRLEAMPLKKRKGRQQETRRLGTAL